MKRILSLVTMVAMNAMVVAVETPEELLRQGLFEEEGNLNLTKAQENYLKLAEQYDQQRRYAATAFFRLGEIARKQGNKDEAGKWYRRVMEEFPQNETLTRLSRQNLKGLGMELPAAAAEGALAAGPSDVQKRELARLEALKKSSPDLVDGADEKGWRPIHHAAAKGWMEVLEYLLKEGANVNGETSGEGWAPLSLAVAHGHLAVVRRLLKSGADIEKEAQIRDKFVGMPAPPEAGQRGYFRPLHLAVLWQRREIVKELLASGAEVDSVGRETIHDDATAAYLAAMTSQTELLNVLVDAGADLNAAKGEDPSGPIVIELMREAPEMLELVLEKGANPNHLHLAVSRYPWAVPALIKAGADVNQPDHRGMVPLHYANREAAEVLLAAGANLEVRDLKGRTPLLANAENGSVEGVGFFLKRGADPTVKMQDGRDIFQAARFLAVPALYEKLVYPEAVQADGVVLFNHGSVNRGREYGGPERGVLAARKRAEGLVPPSLIDLLLVNDIEGVAWIRILRQGEDGTLSPTFALAGPGITQGLSSLPALKWGDLVEVVGQVGSGNYPSVDVRGWWNRLPAREVTIKAGPWQKKETIDPAHSPWHGRGNPSYEQLLLSSQFRYPSEFIDRLKVQVTRGGVTFQIQYQPGRKPGNPKVAPPPPLILQDGDVVEFNLSDALLSGTADRWEGIWFFNTASLGGGRCGDSKAILESRRLFHLLGSMLADPRYGLLNGVDLSEVTIQRPEDGKMKEIKVDVLKVATELLPDGVADKEIAIGDREIELKDGDLLILKPASGEGAKELPNEVRALLEAAAK